MAKKVTSELGDIRGWPERALALRIACGFGERGGSLGFARHLGLTPQRWSQMETGYSPLSVEIATAISRKYPAITWDWLFRGRGDAMPLPWQDALGVMDGTPKPFRRMGEPPRGSRGAL